MSVDHAFRHDTSVEAPVCAAAKHWPDYVASRRENIQAWLAHAQADRHEQA
jgi:hypothetical protein